MSLTKSEQFFYQHAAYSYSPETQTPEQGRQECARALAAAEKRAREHGYRYRWEHDPEIDSTDFQEFSDDDPYPVWQCLMLDPETNELVASLCGVDLGPEGHPSDEPYARVVEAELSREHTE